SAVCTHLGCITQWKPEGNMIACPCHGSKFQPNGKKIEGPASRPLPHYAVTLTVDGELRVDKLQIIKADQVLKVSGKLWPLRSIPLSRASGPHGFGSLSSGAARPSPTAHAASRYSATCSCTGCR